jgi:hypothetical protein
MGERVMSDEFLIRARPTLPEGLEARVLARIAAARARSWPDGRRQHDLQEALSWLRANRLLAIVAGVLLLVGCTTGLLRIAGFVFEPVEAHPTPLPGVEPVPQRTVPRDQALGAIRFQVDLPTWAPQGFELTDQATVTLPENDAGLEEAWQLWLYWENEIGSDLLLLAFPAEFYRGDALPFGPGAVEEIDLNGIPAAVVRGNWAPRGAEGVTWEASLGGNVLWVRGETAYWLQSRSVSLDDLIRMAASVP